MNTSRTIVAFAVAALAALPGHATPVGDTFDLGWNGFFNDAIGQWTWGADEGPVGVDFSNAGGAIGNFTFGTQGSFNFLGNTINVDSQVIETGPTSETWEITVSSADGGPIFDPVDGLADDGGFWRAWHFREIAIGGLGETINPGTPEEEFVWDRGDLLQSPTFIDFASPVGVAVWTADSSTATFLNGETPAETSQVEFFSFGDLDFDGLVNESDYEVWRNNYGATGVEAFQDGDANGDTIVDAADYTLWRDNLGADTRFLDNGETSVFARQEIPFGVETEVPGVLLNRQYGNPGLILFDDGIFEAHNPEVTAITVSVDVITTGPASAVGSAAPEPSSVPALFSTMVFLVGLRVRSSVRVC